MCLSFSVQHIMWIGFQSIDTFGENSSFSGISKIMDREDFSVIMDICRASRNFWNITMVNFHLQVFFNGQNKISIINGELCVRNLERIMSK